MVGVDDLQERNPGQGTHLRLDGFINGLLVSFSM